jgi:hypothetical protein
MLNCIVLEVGDQQAHVVACQAARLWRLVRFQFRWQREVQRTSFKLQHNSFS